MKKLIVPRLPAGLKLRLPTGLSADASALAEAVTQSQRPPLTSQESAGLSSGPGRPSFLTRRHFLRSTLAATALAAGLSRTVRAGDLLPPTPSQTEGPYYRAGAPFRNVLFDEADFVVPLFLFGAVLNTAAEPLPGALVDLWHADASGAYDNSSPEFRGRGRQFADDASGWWAFTTWPGYYPGRTKHIHFKASQDGYRPVTSQLYFQGDPRNPTDPIYSPLLEMEVFEFKEWPGLFWSYFLIVLARA